MAVYPAVGAGPVSFLDANQSEQQIPLSAIFNTPNGWDATNWPPYLAAATAANQPLINALLAQLGSQGFLVPGNPPAIPALSQPTATAAQPGAMGNSITVTFANPTLSTGVVDVVAKATEVYSGLTPSTIQSVLGTSASTASGLVYVSGAPDRKMPANLPGGTINSGSKTLAVPDNAAGTAFTLAATTAPTASVTINVVVALSADQKSFTLTVTCQLSETKVSLANLLNSGSTAATALAYLVSFGGAQSGPLPGSGTVSLSGGSNGRATAVQPGAMGNSISITFANPSASAVDVTVSTTQDYATLTPTPATLAAALGTSPQTATGLVYVQGAISGNMPATTAASPLSGAGSTLAILENGSATTAFTLAATSSSPGVGGNGVNLVDVAVNLAGDESSFELKATWTLAKTQVPLTALLNQSTNPFAYLVSFAGQANGTVPAAGTVSLSGGADPQGGSPASAASAIVSQGTAASACIYSAA